MKSLPKVLLAIFLLAITFVAIADQRYALVVGISDYEESPLKNPTNDAADMATVLTEVGFSVQHLNNVSRKDFRRAIREFSDKLSEEDTGLFYFSGHGVQVKGQNYLIPVGADIEGAFEVEDEAVSVRSILGAMEESGSRLNVVILDACRNNPFRSFRGFSQGLAIVHAPQGTLVAFSTSPGGFASDGSGRNSPYTKHLVRMIRGSGLAVEQLFKKVRIAVVEETRGEQVPWEESSLMSDFFFSEPSNSILDEKLVDKLSQDEKQFLMAVSKMYKGHLSLVGEQGKHPVTTEIVFNEGAAYGLYSMFYENMPEQTGSLRLKEVNIATRELLWEWVDTYGLGQTRFLFDKSLESFEGSYGSDAKFDGDGTWTGKWDEANVVTLHIYGGTYVGEVKNREPHGRGTLSMGESITYVGDWRDGHIIYGTHTMEDGDIYSGAFKEGYYEGAGKYTYPDGTTYVGQFEKDQFYGQGTYTYDDGRVYVGTFKANMFEGEGVLSLVDGSKLIGEFKDDELWNGSEIDENGNVTATYSEGVAEAQ